MANITIKKATLKDHNMFLKVDFEEHLQDNVTNKITRESTAPVHEDLVNAFKELCPHLAMICEEVKEQYFLNATRPDDPKYYIEWPTEVSTLFEDIPKTNPCEWFEVQGIIFSKIRDEDAVMLIGRKILSTGKAMNINSPLTKLDYDGYKYWEDLCLLLEKVKYEILEFLVNGKVAPDQQSKIPFPDEEDSDGSQDDEELTLFE